MDRVEKEFKVKQIQREAGKAWFEKQCQYWGENPWPACVGFVVFDGVELVFAIDWFSKGNVFVGCACICFMVALAIVWGWVSFRTMKSWLKYHKVYKAFLKDYNAQLEAFDGSTLYNKENAKFDELVEKLEKGLGKDAK